MLNNVNVPFPRFGEVNLLLPLKFATRCCVEICNLCVRSACKCSPCVMPSVLVDCEIFCFPVTSGQGCLTWTDSFSLYDSVHKRARLLYSRNLFYLNVMKGIEYHSLFQVTASDSFKQTENDVLAIWILTVSIGSGLIEWPNTSKKKINFKAWFSSEGMKA